MEGSKSHGNQVLFYPAVNLAQVEEGHSRRGRLGIGQGRGITGLAFQGPQKDLFRRLKPEFIQAV